MEKRNNSFVPELLAPAGSFDALQAAIAAGADAVYLGASDFNARIGAKNFSDDEMRRSLSLCRAHGVRTNITMNTLVSDREMRSFLETAYKVLSHGADALIVADLGAAALIKKYFPEAELHASTQLSVHSLDGAIEMANRGFSRVVLARELSRADIETVCRHSPIEVETFIHGALCVSHSGQCLASSLIGGRSGNRGLCAQPCRLPYNNNKYLLSLKDYCLASHIEEILSLGVSSLKIEGRMKPPEYVYGVVRIYRTLLDEKRNASEDEIAELAEIFSRSGFTDAYFKGRLSDKTKTGSMLGVRTDADKAKSRTREEFSGLNEKIPLDITVTIKRGEPSLVKVSDGERQACAEGSVPEEARTAPLSQDDLVRCASKLGDTPYFAKNIETELDEGLILRISELNALRRAAIDKLLCPNTKVNELPAQAPSLPEPMKAKEKTRSARFLTVEQIEGLGEDKKYFDRIYLPLQSFKANCGANGVVLPPVIFDSEREKLISMLENARNAGAEYALVSNIGQIEAARAAGFELHGDFRLNVWNSYTARALCEQLESVMLSPELSSAMARDINVPKSTIVYGKVPLMLLERCVIKDSVGCAKCRDNAFSIKDRTGAEFTVVREFDHRNTVYNSVPIYMADRRRSLLEMSSDDEHFIFSDEAPAECRRIVAAYKKELEPNGMIRRIK